ncbi:MAG: beta-glucosidase BglX [Bacteroidetes bacterium]|nr:MAG: beta-glucosidase BglX [Bacteroidota bacterium]
MAYSYTRFLLLLLAGLAILSFSYYVPDGDHVPSTGKPDLDARVDSLLMQMTLEEKIGQMVMYTGYAELTGPGAKTGGTLEKHNQIKNGLVGSMINVVSAASTREAQQLAVENSRLGIPMIFGYDVIHGFRTMFPIPLGEAASWDLEAIRRSAAVAAKEAAAAGVHWTFAPMVDIYRDARWGRVMEGAGEDPYLGALVGAARVRGFQGDDLSADFTIAACAKHFAGYGFAEAGRDYNTVDVSEHTLHNVILPPFKACVDAGVATFMNAFNELGGIPATAHQYLQRDLLKGQWGFEGMVVSDWGSIAEMVAHGVAENNRGAAVLAIQAGCDMDMEGYCYQNELAGLVRDGKVQEALIDDAVRRILRLKFQLGLFDDPYKYCKEENEHKYIYTPEHLEVARDVARRSIVLLENTGSLLPIRKDVSSIAVIGPLADDKDTPLGNWRGQAVTNSAVSLLEGIRAAAPAGTTVRYAEGCKLSIGPESFGEELVLNRDDRSQFGAAVQLARESDLVILAIGEDARQTGEGRSQVDIGLHGVQQELVDAVYAANPNTVVVLMSGRPLAIPEVAAKVPAIMAVWHLGSEAGNAIADVLFGAYNPSGKLPMSFPRHVGQCPIYYGQKNTGRPGPKAEVFWSHYTDSENDPLWPFGYGLSYTSFEYSNLQLSTHKMKSGETLTVSVEVTNTGEMDGEEVVQLYITDPIGRATRPKRELKRFEKINIPKGKTTRVQFELTEKDLAYYTPDRRWKAEPGAFLVYVGTDSNASLQAGFELEATTR